MITVPLGRQPQRAVCLSLTADGVDVIARHAEGVYPAECVGLLCGQCTHGISVVHYALALENRWKTEYGGSDQHRFLLDPRDYLVADRAARAAGLEIIGCYHSHPDAAAVPSPYDRQGAAGGGEHFIFVIQSVYQGRATDLSAWLLRHAAGGWEPVTLVAPGTRYAL